jgi:hypothetical protein
MINGHDGALIWDLELDSVVATLSTEVQYGVFVPNGAFLLGLGRGKTFVYSIPGGELVNAYDTELMKGVLVAGTPWVVGLDLDEPAILKVFDYVAGRLVDTIDTRLDNEDDTAAFYELAISPDGALLYSWAIISDVSSVVICHDLVGDSVRFVVDAQIVSSFGITPDGTELWIVEPGKAPKPGVIHIRNAQSGELVTTINTQEVGYFWLREVDFCDESAKAYVTSQSVAPIIVIDTKTHLIARAIEPTS